MLASPVAEVGRDHDYDWAIAEPSSMRSIIQLAGRIRRHRLGPCGNDNLYLLARNIKALQGCSIAFGKPGFESTDFPLASHDLRDLLADKSLAIDAAPRIAEPGELHPGRRLVDLEHTRLRVLLLGLGSAATRFTAPLWWQTPAPLSGVLQRAQPFREGPAQRRYALLPEEDGGQALAFHRYDEDGEWTAKGNLLGALPLQHGQRVQTWGGGDYLDDLAGLAARLGLSWRTCAERFGYVQLDEAHEAQGWQWHALLGFSRRR